MVKARQNELILIPDYLSCALGVGNTPVLGEAAKLPAELTGKNFFDVNDAQSRIKLMLLVPEIARASVFTPPMSYYRRLAELRDDCFFANLTLRLLAGGAFITIKSGMCREMVPPGAAAWMKELVRTGVRIEYQQLQRPEPAQKELITAADVSACARQGRRELVAAHNAIVTPYARDEAKEKGITILVGRGGQT